MLNDDANTKPIKKYTFKQKITYTAFSLLIFFILLSLIGEAAVRFHSLKKTGTFNHILLPYNTAQKDDLLGWKMTPNYSFSGKLDDQEGQTYSVNIQYDENGFKAFGDTTSLQPKLFFVGDSYTASVEVSNEKSFFNLIKDSLGVEVFAYGHAGFSTLQEYLIFDKWVDIIKPDLVVWEVCSNDFIDNYAPLEMVCGYKVGERRPYLGGDEGMFYKDPSNAWEKVKKIMQSYAWLERWWNGIKKRIFGIEARRGEYFITTQGRAFKPYDEAVRTTEEIFEKIKQRKPDSLEILVFSADSYQPQLEEFKRISKHNGFNFTASPTLAIDAATYGPEQMTVRASDGYHWNEAGHQIIANSLIPLIEAELGK